MSQKIIITISEGKHVNITFDPPIVNNEEDFNKLTQVTKLNQNIAIQMSQKIAEYTGARDINVN